MSFFSEKTFPFRISHTLPLSLTNFSRIEECQQEDHIILIVGPSISETRGDQEYCEEEQLLSVGPTWQGRAGHTLPTKAEGSSPPPPPFFLLCHHHSHFLPLLLLPIFLTIKESTHSPKLPLILQPAITNQAKAH